MKGSALGRDILITLSRGDSSDLEYSHNPIELADFFVHEVPSGQHGCLAHKAMGGSLRIGQRELSDHQDLLQESEEINRNHELKM